MGSPVGGASPVAAGPAAPAGRIAISKLGELTLVEAGTGAAQPIKIGPASGDSIDPAWSPDGQEFVYVLQTAPAPNENPPIGRAALRAYQPTTKTDRLIYEEPPGALLYRPAWAPDGQSVYYTRVEHHFEGARYTGYQEMIMRVGRDGQNPARILLDAASPAPSPDGRQIAFLTHEPAPLEPGLWRLNLADNSTTLLLATPSPIEVNGPAYAPDGQTIAFAASALTSRANFKTSRAFWEPPVAAAHGLPADVWLISPDGGSPRQLSKLNEDRMVPAWSPDGQSIAALGLAGLYIFGLDGTQRTRFDKLGGEGTLAWGKAP